VSEVKLRGGCLCGGVQYEISGEPVRFYHCHCSRCRKATGTGHASNIMVKLRDAAWTKGEELIAQYKVPEAQRFGTCFCTRCGGQLPRIRKEMGMAIVPAGSLDTDSGMMPEARIFWDSRAAWSCQGDGIPTYAEYPQRG
jgi:hypothetical protein